MNFILTSAIAFSVAADPISPVVLSHLSVTPRSGNRPEPTLLSIPSAQIFPFPTFTPLAQASMLNARPARLPTLATPNTENGKRFQQIMADAIAQDLFQRSMGEIIQAIAEQFLGAAYRAGLLDQAAQETLVVNLQEFDCVLFVETVVAIAQGIAAQDYAYSTFVEHLRRLRYRQAQLDGYCSRLHYFSDWMGDNQQRGTLQDVALRLGGITTHKTLNFMSTHRSRYPQLYNHEANYQCIVAMEANLGGTPINYIPQRQIRKVYPQLQPGDIIGITTQIPGLDVTHTGLVYRTSNGGVGLIHASPAGQVTIARDLQHYVGNIHHGIGILVARVNGADSH
ncbi:MAG: DUF1460 domain-containing protein [Cyanothece sp. SIO1E1]|nr:DUF1460 domain-containing protein [Cyanothece sp. SIO1E1]